MYVVRRAFRNYNAMLVPGTAVEPEQIKRFKSRLNERDIIEVTDDTFNMWNQYFIDKFGTPIAKPAEPVEPVEPVELVEPVEPVEPAKPVTAKITPKVVVKAT